MPLGVCAWQRRHAGFLSLLHSRDRHRPAACVNGPGHLHDEDNGTVVQTVTRLYVNKAQFISMNSQLTEQLGLAKVAGTLSKSTEVMSIVNDLMRTPALMRDMQQMSREMMKVRTVTNLSSMRLVTAWKG